MKQEHSPITLLMKEHDVILSVRQIIEALDNLWVKDDAAYRDKVEELISFFRIYSDKFHHEKEETILFRQLKDHPDFRLHDLIDELEEHHENFRLQVAAIEQALTDNKWTQVQKLLLEYTDALADHIAVENDELFVMTEMLFSEEELSRMYFLFEDLDRQLGLEKKNVLEHFVEDGSTVHGD